MLTLEDHTDLDNISRNAESGLYCSISLTWFSYICSCGTALLLQGICLAFSATVATLLSVLGCLSSLSAFIRIKAEREIGSSGENRAEVGR